MSKGIAQQHGSTTNRSELLPRPNLRVPVGVSVVLLLAYVLGTMSAPLTSPVLAQAVEDGQVALGLDISRGERER